MNWEDFEFELDWGPTVWEIFGVLLVLFLAAFVTAMAWAREQIRRGDYEDE